MMVLVQNVLVCLMGAAIQELCTYNYVSFPLQAGAPVADSSLHLQRWHCTTKSPPGSLRKNLGYKSPCRIASRRHSRAIVNKNILELCISMKNNWKTLTSLGFPVFFFEPYRGGLRYRMSIHSHATLYAQGSAETDHSKPEINKRSTTISIKFTLHMILWPVKIEK